MDTIELVVSDFPSMEENIYPDTYYWISGYVRDSCSDCLSQLSSYRLK